MSVRGLLFVLLTVGCNGALEVTPDGGDGDATIDVTCPGSVPASGTHCVFGLECEYGGVNGQCTTLATCGGAVLDGTWTVTPPPNGCGLNQPSCPASFDALPAFATCPLASAASCTYPEGVCECTSCSGDAGPSTQWTCRAFEVGSSACASPRPPLGSACTSEDTSCTWSCCESISFGPDEVCTNGHWKSQPCTAFCQAPPHCGP